MVSSDCFLLQHEEFKSNFVGSFQSLRTSGDFLDVTLACGEETFEAHKVVLSAFSPFLRRVLIKSKQPHPYIYLKGILPQDLEAIVDYLYNGETKVGADDVDRFIEAATELQIDGLMAQDVSGRIQEEDQHPKEESEFVFEQLEILKNPEMDGTSASPIKKKVRQKTVIKPVQVKQESKEDHDDADEYDTSNDTMDSDDASKIEKGLIENEGDEMMTKLLHEISQKMEKVDSESRGKVWRCKECGKVSNKKLKLGMHIETHIEGFSHTCKFCNKIYQTRNSLQTHKYQAHKGQ